MSSSISSSFVRFLLIGSVFAMLAGCAHSIKIAPDPAVLEKNPVAQNRIQARVGYYVPPELMALEVTTPGGGGDNVKYHPYRDMEQGYSQMLGNVFSSVVKMQAAPSLANTKSQVDYVVQPELMTSSGGSGLFTWPPTNFSVDLTSTFRDVSGNVVGRPRVLGIGAAETGERMLEHGIAGRRAMENALNKMKSAILEEKFAVVPVVTPPAPTRTVRTSADAGDGPIAGRLAELKSLLDKGLITLPEYEAKRGEILDQI